MFLTPGPWVWNSQPLWKDFLAISVVLKEGRWTCIFTRNLILSICIRHWECHYMSSLPAAAGITPGSAVWAVLSSLFRPSQLGWGWFELLLNFWPKLSREQLLEWFSCCAHLICCLWVCLEGVCTCDTADCLGDLKDRFGPAFCSLGKICHVFPNRNTIRMVQILLPGF